MNLLGNILLAAMMLGFLVALMPLAIVVPEHGHLLVRIQAGGAVVAILCIILFCIGGAVAAFHDHFEP